MSEQQFETWAREWTERSRIASRSIANASPAQKDAVLMRLASLLRLNQDQIEKENQKDVALAKERGLSSALVDRLELSGTRIEKLAQSVEEVARLPDPVGDIESITTQPSGIRVGRMRVPLGVILIVYESRPNVTIDAAILCMKAGNAVILRGGKEAAYTNQLLSTLVRRALREEGVHEDVVTLIDKPDRDALYTLLKQSGQIDLAIPRGGTSLIDAVNQHARVPVVQHYQGICHVYVHRDAKIDQAIEIILNAKVQRPGVCNALECVVVDDEVASNLLPALFDKLTKAGVEVRACERSLSLAGTNHPGVKAAVQDDFSTEFLDAICAVKVVRDIDECFSFLQAHGSQHTESIVTENHSAAMRFLRTVDASCVMVNASTRFNDGGQLGLGAELGISTTKLHAYGPMGLEELCARKFIVLGEGHIRTS